MEASFRDRLAGALGAAIVVGGIGAGLLWGMVVASEVREEPAVTLLDLRPPEPVRRPEPPIHRVAEKAAGMPAPRNLRNRAAEVAAVPEVLPVSSPVVAAPRPDIGMAASAGASDLPGPGDGAGGGGNGRGGGGDGEGDGDDTPPRQIGGRLRLSDVPAEWRDAGTGGRVEVRYRVGIDGRVSGCLVTGSSGDAALDALTCRLIEQRFRFRPSRDRDGQPVRSVIEEAHEWVFDREEGHVRR